MRPLRRLEPGVTWFVTSRCDGARFLLRPDPELRVLCGFLLARAAAHFPGIHIHAVVVMSNHLHMILTDEASELSYFMSDFLGSLARRVNQLRGRRGHVFERRFSAEPILDTEALAERTRYLLLNPVKDSLVDRHDDWPGLLVWADAEFGVPKELAYSWFQRGRYERACRDAADTNAFCDRDAFVDRVTLRLFPLPSLADAPTQPDSAPCQPARILAMVCAAEDDHRRLRLDENRTVLGAEAVAAQCPDDAPKRPKRSPRPLCHTTWREMWKMYKQLLRALRRAYAAASAAFRAGDFHAVFPPFHFRPPGLVVPLAA